MAFLYGDVQRGLAAVSRELPAFYARAVRADVAVAGAQAGARAVKAASPVGRTRNLKRSIGAIRRSKGGYAVVGARVGGSHRGYHAHFIDRGTGDRVQSSTGRRTGRVRARPFFEAALRAARPAIFRAMALKIRPAFQRAAQRLAREVRR